MSICRQQYEARRYGEVWWGVWDHDTQRFVDGRRWVDRLYPEIAASRLNHDIPEAGEMSTSDGLGA